MNCGARCAWMRVTAMHLSGVWEAQEMRFPRRDAARYHRYSTLTAFLKGNHIVRVIPAFQRLPSFVLCLVLLVLMGGTHARAQEATPTPAPDPTVTRAYRPAAMFAGPGETHELYGW